jgi:mono/diheme cytochrome c family protein
MAKKRNLVFVAIALTMTALELPLLSLIAADSTSSTWTAPASEAAKKNPVAANQSSIAAGQKIYTKRCASCHGTSGNGDGPNAVDLGIHPAKLSQITGSETDGALFWKITTGKKPMPAFPSRRLSESDRWNVINYIRTLAKH